MKPVDYEKLPVDEFEVPRRRRWFRHSFILGALGLLALFHQFGRFYSFHPLKEPNPFEVFQKALETNLAGNWSKIYTAEPHLAGTNIGLVNFTRDKFEEYGLKASVDQYDVLVSYPLDHALSLVDSKSGKILYRAPLEEDVIDEDSSTKGDDRVPTFLGYAANGNVTAPYVYVNYGTKEDFAKLKELNVDIKGKIAVARYGRIFRGLKVKFAQDEGAVGVLLYSDPGDDSGITPANGYKQYPKGPARQESSVQRGSVQFLGGEGAYPGDPTTPGYASKPGVGRKDPYKAIGKIPALPISYREVKPILKALNGHGVKLEDKKWIGELEDFEYYTGPAKGLSLNLYNHQNFTIAPLHNVYGEIEGEVKDEVILIGNHRDAWIKGGAGDPNSGSAVLIELARAFGDLVKSGYKFKRTIILQSWDGEEYGLLGSTEFGENVSKLLQKTVVAYLNVDVAVSSKNLDLGASPALFNILKKVAAQVEYPEEGVGSLLDHYNNRTGGVISHLGSGSDYTVFLEHLGIPSADIGFGGGDKNSPIYHYHSNYDSYHWMEKYGDVGFVFHNTLAKFLGQVALEINNRAVIDFKFTDYSDALIEYFDDVVKKIPHDWLSLAVDSFPRKWHGEKWAHQSKHKEHHERPEHFKHEGHHGPEHFEPKGHHERPAHFEQEGPNPHPHGSEHSEHKGEYRGKHHEDEYRGRHHEDEYRGRHHEDEHRGKHHEDEYRGKHHEDEYRGKHHEDEYRGRHHEDEHRGKHHEDEYRGKHHEDEYRGKHHEDEYRGRHHEDEYRGRHHEDEHRGKHHEDEYRGRHHEDEYRGKHHEDEYRGKHHEDEHRGKHHEDEHRGEVTEFESEHFDRKAEFKNNQSGGKGVPQWKHHDGDHHPGRRMHHRKMHHHSFLRHADKFFKEITNGYYGGQSKPFFSKGCHGSKGRKFSMFHFEDDKEAHTLEDVINSTYTQLLKLKSATTVFDLETDELQTKWDNIDSLYIWQKIKLIFDIRRHNKLTQYFERNFLYEPGLHRRHWFKHIIFASGRFTGYAGQVFPILIEPIEDGDWKRLVKGLHIVNSTFRRISDHLLV